MEPLSSLAAIGGGLLVLVIIGAVLFAFWRGSDSRPLLLDAALRRQGNDVAYRALSSGSHDFAAAVQRCLACNQAAQCSAWLASGAKDGYQWFCPNAGYIKRMKDLA